MTEERRIAAVLLPELLLELARRSRAPVGRGRGRGRAPREGAWAVVLLEDFDAPEAQATSVLGAVSALAFKHGVRAGQTLTEARAIVASLVVRTVQKRAVLSALEVVAEAALAMGPTVSLGSPDTVWVDVSGSAHLWGGEAALAMELSSRVRELGHEVRVALASGPRLAAAFARWPPPEGQRTGEYGVCIVPTQDSERCAAELPLAALGLPTELHGWFGRLGVLSLGELSRLPRSQLSVRLGAQHESVLSLGRGQDSTPLVPYRPPIVPHEHMEWDEPVEGLEPLKFVLRGLCSRLAARLAGRGEAARKLELVLHHDPAIARVRGAPRDLPLVVELGTDLWRQEELLAVLVAKLSRMKLEAPSLGLTLSAPSVVRAIARQLDLARVVSKVTGVESLPSLVAELTADLGAGSVGILNLVDSHRPEAQAELLPAFAGKEPAAPARGKRRRRPAETQLLLSRVRPVGIRTPPPTRLLATPVALDGPLRRGAMLCFDHRLFTIERIRFEERLDAVEWWTDKPVARDYLRLVLSEAEGVLEAQVFLDRSTGKRFVAALWD